MGISYRLLRLLTHAWFILYARGRVFGMRRVPREGAVLLACNHQSYLDPIFVALPLERECHFMARDTLFRNRWFGRFIAFLNAFPVRRGAADVGAIKQCLRRLGERQVVVTFPEGTRSPDGSILPVHAGIVAIAKRAGCPIVPTILEGAFDVWPRNRKYPGMARVWVLYGRPITPEELAAVDAEEGARCLTDRLRRLHNALRRQIGRRPFEYAADPRTSSDEPASGIRVKPPAAGAEAGRPRA